MSVWLILTNPAEIWLEPMYKLVTMYILFDAGITINGKHEKGQVGAVDDRAGFKLTTCSPDMLNVADLIVMHTGISDSYLVRTRHLYYG